MKRAVYYDSDPDGFTAAAVLKYKFPDLELIPLSHEKRVTPKLVEGYDEVYLVDFAFEQEDMDFLKDNNEHFIWIDHHESIIKKFPTTYEGLRDIDSSAAMLSWKYCFPAKTIPQLIHHVNDYDTWQFNLPDTRKFMFYFDSKITLDNEVKDIIPMIEYTAEEYIEIYKTARLLEILIDKQLEFDVNINSKGTFEGHPARIFFYAGKYRSALAQQAIDTFDDVDLFVFMTVNDIDNKRAYKYSLRSRQTSEVDCGSISNKFPGGGGHKHAAGFIIDKLIL